MLNTQIKNTDKILISGAGGFIGSHIVSCLIDYGFTNLRCFMRSSSNANPYESILKSNSHVKIEIIKGNLLILQDCVQAVKDVAVVYHLAAGRGKSFSGCFLDSAVATKNLLDALVHNKTLKRFVNVSSFSVYSNIAIPRYGLLDENCPVEREYMIRYDPYTFGKVKQDDFVLQYHKEFAIPYTIIRPGIVFGPGRGGTILGRAGIDTFGFFLQIGGKQQIPLTYVDNCADAIVRAGLMNDIDGQIFNIVDDDLPTASQLVKKIKKQVKPFFSFTVPYHCFYLFNYLWEKYSAWSKGQLPPAFNRRMCETAFKGNNYSNEKVKRLLQWKPKVTMNEGLERYFTFLRNNKEHTS